jgi:hypothetical protein
MLSRHLRDIFPSHHSLARTGQAGPITKSSDTISVITDPLWHGWAWTCLGWQSLLQSIIVPATRSRSASLATTKWVKLAMSGLTICRLDADQIEHPSWDMPVNPNPLHELEPGFSSSFARQINFIDVYYTCSPDMTLTRVHITLHSFASPLSLKQAA